MNTHPDLLLPAEDTEKLLAEDRALLVKALTPRVLPRGTKATVKAIGPQVAARGTVAPKNRARVALKKALQSYEKAIITGVVTRKAFKARETPTSLRVVPRRASSPCEKNSYFHKYRDVPLEENSYKSDKTANGEPISTTAELSQECVRQPW